MRPADYMIALIQYKERRESELRATNIKYAQMHTHKVNRESRAYDFVTGQIAALKSSLRDLKETFRQLGIEWRED